MLNKWPTVSWVFPAECWWAICPKAGDLGLGHPRKHSETDSTQPESTQEVTGTQTHQWDCISHGAVGLEITAADMEWGSVYSLGKAPIDKWWCQKGRMFSSQWWKETGSGLHLKQKAHLKGLDFKHSISHTRLLKEKNTHSTNSALLGLSIRLCTGIYLSFEHAFCWNLHIIISKAISCSQ